MWSVDSDAWEDKVVKRGETPQSEQRDFCISGRSSHGWSCWTLQYFSRETKRSHGNLMEKSQEQTFSWKNLSIWRTGQKKDAWHSCVREKDTGLWGKKPHSYSEHRLFVVLLSLPIYWFVLVSSRLLGKNVLQNHEAVWEQLTWLIVILW